MRSKNVAWSHCRRIHQRLMNCATLRTMNYSAKLFDCRTMYSTHYYHRYPPPHNAITSDTVRTPYSLNIQHNYPILISQHACYIRTHIRLSSLVYFFCYCLFATSCWPAFCHAVINELAYWLINWLSIRLNDQNVIPYYSTTTLTRTTAERHLRHRS